MEQVIIRKQRFERFQKFQNLFKLSRNHLKDISNPLELYNETSFRQRFRFRKTVITQFLLPIIKSKLISLKGGAVPIVYQLLVALRFLATGSFQSVIADTVRISQPTVHRIVVKVCTALASVRSQFIKFPTENKAIAVRDKFYNIANFPGVIGAIDCTHIRIKSPGGEDAEVYRNRKGFFSINVQAICSPNLSFTNIVARWKGSTHDSRIFENSKIQFKLSEGQAPRGHLIGDSGYPCRKYILTPFSKPTTAAQKRYNSAHVKTRNPIERAFGVMKKRFNAVGEILRTKLKNSLTIIVACFVLHNIAIMCNDLWNEDEDDLYNQPEEVDYEFNPNLPADRIGREFRERITRNYFGQS